MSRSYKKTPVCKDNKKSSKGNKQVANKKVRNSKIVSSGKSYKKIYNSCDIHDYISRYSYEEFIIDFYKNLSYYEIGRNNYYPSFTENDWFHSYKRK